MSKKFVDLGLSSGTLWASENETEELLDYDEAMIKFGCNLPSREQWEELLTECRYMVVSSGVQFVGPNGNSILLAPNGCDFGCGAIEDYGSFGYYWSSEIFQRDLVWRLLFGIAKVGKKDNLIMRVDKARKYHRLSVRLVKNNECEKVSTTSSNDNVSHPSHYTSHPSGVECIEIARHYCFDIGCAIKYLWRAGLKKEEGLSDRQKEIEDLEKAVWYIKDRIEQLKKESNG